MRAAFGPLCLLALLGISFACQGDEPESTGSLKAPIHYGTEDLEHEAVGFINCAVSGGYSLCTGTLIAPGTVLTAAHCITAKNVANPESCVVAFGPKDPFSEIVGVVGAYPHPGYLRDWDHGLPMDDVAILRLEYSPEGVEPIPALPASMGGVLQRGVPIEIVGYGLTESGSIGTRLHTTVPLLGVCRDEAGCDGESLGSPRLAPRTISYDCTASSTDHGDSGGAALLSVDGTGDVAGATSAGILNFIGVSAKVDEYEPFLSRKYGGESCESAGECESGFCSQGVCCDKECDGLCRACSRAAGAKQDGVCGRASGVPCDDGDPCTVDNVCRSGLCTGAPKCDLGSVCNAGTCESKGCSSAGGVMPLWLAATAVFGAVRVRRR